MAKFIKSAVNTSHYINDNVSEICFVGRSNVGKSSVINALAKGKIAKTSNTPGRTQLVNFFDFKFFRLVDLPGYGFAKVSKGKQRELAMIIEEYLSERTNLKGVIQICDISVITNIDAEMSRFFENNYPNHYVVLNKTDKLAKSHFFNKRFQIASYLNISVDRLIPLSAAKGSNLDALNKVLKKIALDERDKQRELNKAAKKAEDEENGSEDEENGSEVR